MDEVRVQETPALVSKDASGEDMANLFTSELEVLGARITVELAAEGGERSDYQVNVSEDRPDEHTVLITASIYRTDGQPFVLKRFRAAAWVPLVDIHGVWSGYAERLHTDSIPGRHESIVSSNSGFPFVLLMHRSGMSRLAFGLLNQIPETRMVYAMEEVGAGYEAFFERPPFEEMHGCARYEETAYISRRPEPWHAAVAAYVQAVDGADATRSPLVPDAAREPVFCSWYAVHHDVTADWIERQVKVASELGFRTLIVDDGWFLEGSGDWGGYPGTGDWKVAKSKFPDFAEHVKRVQSLGVKYLLWIAPFMVGRRSESFTRLSRLFHTTDLGSFMGLCPRCQEVHDHLVGVMKHLMTDYGLDGFKMDFMDVVDRGPCRGSHSHDYKTQGAAMDVFLTRVRKELGAVNPNVLLEFRQPYANLVGRRYCTMFRAVDAPLDFDTNLWRIAMMRSYAGAFPVHFDPAYWNALESEESVARHMICSVFCVPMISVDLEKLPVEHLRIIRRWMDFYRRDKRLMNVGDYVPDMSNAAIDSLAVRDGVRAVIGLFRGSTVPPPGEGVDAVEVLNASNSDLLVLHEGYAGWACEAQNRFGDTLGRGTISGGMVQVPIGGLLALRAE